MTEKAGKSRADDEVRFELKYCERCGGLWLRPVGSGQTYCVACGRQMSELPAPSRHLDRVSLPKGPQWGADEEEFEQDDEVDLDAAGGAA
jgi:hypothetical protein